MEAARQKMLTFAMDCSKGDIMISKNEVRYIRSLKQKKYRIREGRFLAEGEKLVEDLILSGWIPD
ncbi:MAG: hypothetical protein LPK47_10290, partial [Bacteroidota bacterium]|nr:hypothetical protein [Bacteroidota bacterium]